jgi:hypothetical protein
MLSLTGDRWFESGSLQRGVSCEPNFLEAGAEEFAPAEREVWHIGMPAMARHSCSCRKKNVRAPQNSTRCEQTLGASLEENGETPLHRKRMAAVAITVKMTAESR